MTDRPGGRARTACPGAKANGAQVQTPRLRWDAGRWWGAEIVDRFATEYAPGKTLVRSREICTSGCERKAQRGHLLGSLGTDEVVLSTHAPAWLERGPVTFALEGTRAKAR